MLQERQLAFDCRHFLGDRPCRPHKETGAVCVCPSYAQVRGRVLMIKLDAMGDVLRTTALLPALAAAHPGYAIDWITRSESLPLLENNPYLSQVIAYGPDALVRLAAVEYDRVINLDAGVVSAGLATASRGRQKDGYVLAPEGHVTATNPAAMEWLQMGTNDDLKRANQTRSYQEIMLGILGMQGAEHRYVLELRGSERARAAGHLASLGIDRGRPIVGFNMGAGGRWELKRWRAEGYAELAERLAAQGVQIVLLGGQAEIELHRRFAALCRVRCIDAGNNHDLRMFSALVGECDVVVTGDTLAMHIALALNRKAVVLFGPTSAPEIELYGMGEKVVPDMPCLGCYKNSCDFKPNCMTAISAEVTEAAISRILQQPRI